MNARARQLLEKAIAATKTANELSEASVRLPPRGHIWLGTYTGIEPGTQITRSTGLTNRDAALALTRTWEGRARRARQARQAAGVGRTQARRQPANLTQAEIAVFLGLSERAVRGIEQRALRKLRRHPSLRAIWAEFGSGRPVDESAVRLEPEEIEALFGLARTRFERQILVKVLRLFRAGV